MSSVDYILTILIPTYNRCDFLKYNLELLERYLLTDKLQGRVKILVSDNSSEDNTLSVVRHIIEKSPINITLLSQKNNLGYTSNVLELLHHADTDWVMLLGDDDYLESWYIKDCLCNIINKPKLGCIVSNNQGIYPDRSLIWGDIRETYVDDSYYEAGYEACRQNAWRAHQVSGICFRRGNVYEEFIRLKINNIYPQIFFVAYNALRYDVFYSAKLNVLVTDVPSDKKNWVYKGDFFVSEIFQNFKFLGISYIQRARLESYFIQKQPRYLWAHNQEDINQAVEKIIKGKNTSLLGSYYISKQILHQCTYTGKKLKIWFKIVRCLT